MSDNFTYQAPDEELYLSTIKKYLQRTGDSEALALIKGAKCSIRHSNTFSRKRWNAFFTEILFYVPVERLDSVTLEIRMRLLDVCDKIMPPEIGFDVMSVDFSPVLESFEDTNDLMEDLNALAVKKTTEPSFIILPDDIRHKGEEMAEVYLYLYCVENSLRLFIEAVGKSHNLFIPLSLKKSIQVRKEQESKNQWISIRGDSDFYYMDFKDLGTLIVNNWEAFKSYFPDQAWISTKIEELGSCRNLVAHNSYIGKHERDLIRLYYNSILKQINSST